MICVPAHVKSFAEDKNKVETPPTPLRGVEHCHKNWAFLFSAQNWMKINIPEHTSPYMPRMVEIHASTSVAQTKFIIIYIDKSKHTHIN